MTDLNRPARLNRTGLAVVGLVLLAAGGFAVATHVGVLTVVDSRSTLVPGTEAPPTWVLHVVVAVGVIAGALMVRWLLAQLVRTPRTHTWRLERDSGRGRTELAASTATIPLVRELATYAGVHAVHATLAGTREAPVLAVVIGLKQDGDLTAIRERIGTTGLPRLRQALDLDALPTTVEFRATTTTGVRVR
jgi:H+/Cl- antiporter ClcA